MKHLITTILILTFAISAHQESKDHIKAACIEASEVDETKLLKAREGTYVEDDQVSAYFHCFFMHMGFIKFTAEVIEKEKILEKLPISDKHKLKKTVDSCISNLKQDVDMRAHELYTCFVKQLGPIYNFA